MIQKNYKGDLDEPIMDTVKRDLYSFFVKIRFVLLPFTKEEKVKELRDWDLFGPLLIAIGLTIIMMFKGSIFDINHLFAANFLLIFIGSSLVTMNAKLVGVRYSFFFYSSALGYCLAPFIFAALANLFFGKIITRLGILLITGFCYLWCLRSITIFFQLTIIPSRKYLVLYPVCLYYLFFAWFIVLE